MKPLLALLGALYGMTAALAQEEPLQRVLDEARIAAGAPGAILGVLGADGDIAVLVSGTRDLAGSEPLDPDQPFYLGSISKTYTAALVLRLADLGLVRLDDPLSRHLPAFPRAVDITLRQLLAQTSGLRDFYMYLYFRPQREEMIDLVTREWTEAELLELAGRFGHRFEPGADWDYSSTNYYLLGVVAERVTSLSLSQAYERYLYEPLAIDATWLAWHEPAKGSVPEGHLGPVGGWDHSEMFGELGATTVLDRSPVEWGAGGLVAPARDALRFMDGLRGGRLLTDTAWQAMTTFRPTPPLGIDAATESAEAAGNGYGLGLVRMPRAGYTVLGHGGLFTGHTAGLWYVPECSVVISVYLNRGFVGQRALLDRVIETVAQGESTLARCRKAAP